MPRRSSRVRASTSGVTLDKPSESSSSDVPASPYRPKPDTPRKKAKTTSSIPTTQKANLHEIDRGLCLITQQVNPKSVQVCHILRRRTLDAEVENYKAMWKLKEINIDSTANLVSLRADWHALYDGDCWAFAPSLEVLKKMEEFAGKGTFQTPYRGFSKARALKYVFVPFRTFGLRFIHRDRPDHENFDTYWARDNFAGFPTLIHHSHPYFVIANALPKFHANPTGLTQMHVDIYASMLKIYGFWEKTLTPSSLPAASHKRQRDSDEEPSDEEPGDDPRDETGKRQAKVPRRGRSTKQPPAVAPTAGKGKDRQRDASKTSSLKQTPYPSPPRTALPYADSSNPPVSYYDHKGNILAWIDGVTTAGSPETVGEDEIGSNDEIVRQPYKGNWHDWCYPWTQPPTTAHFSSNDWAMQHYMCKLTDEPGGWDFADEDSSDGGFGLDSGPDGITLDV